MQTIRPEFVRSLFSRIEGAPFELTLWDGKKTRFGEGRPKFHLIIKKPRVVSKILRSPTLGFGEAYMAGDIDVEGEFSALIAIGIENQTRFDHLLRSSIIGAFIQRINRSTSIAKQRKDIAHHYDLGNDFYKLWLDQQMVYSCAYFKTPRDSINQAQRQKINHTLAKLRLKRGEYLLDVGSGWGALIINAAKKYGVKATGITLSREQLKWTRDRIKKEGLSKLVNAEYLDYREIPKSWRDKFDKWVSVGMYEHVGKANWPVFMNQIKKVLKPSGIGLLHSISSQTDSQGDPFVLKYIFPGGYIPPISQMTADLQARDMFVLDMENLWRHYALTLNRWLANFEKEADKIRVMYDEKFVRMWRLYLAGAEQSFAHGHSQVVQILFSNGRRPDWPLTRIA